METRRLWLCAHETPTGPLDSKWTCMWTRRSLKGGNWKNCFHHSKFVNASNSLLNLHWWHVPLCPTSGAGSGSGGSSGTSSPSLRSFRPANRSLMSTPRVWKGRGMSFFNIFHLLKSYQTLKSLSGFDAGFQTSHSKLRWCRGPQSLATVPSHKKNKRS